MTDAIEKFTCINRLLRIYGELLSPTQKKMMEDHYLYDLSVSEIAIKRSVTRSACQDALTKGVKRLFVFEEKLHLDQRNELLRQLLTAMEACDQQKMMALKKVIEDGI